MKMSLQNNLDVLQMCWKMNAVISSHADWSDEICDPPLEEVSYPIAKIKLQKS